MNELINKILLSNESLKKNIDYINYITSLESDDVIVEKYFSNEDGVRLDIITNEFNYRVYVEFEDYGKYLLEIRKKLSEIYKSYGVHWEIYYSINNNHIVTIEEREKLNVCSEKDITCDELLLNWKRTLDILSEKLKLSDIFEQIKDKVTSYKKIEIKKLIIIRDSLVNASDFAFSFGHEVILLEDFDFVLCLTNYKGDLIQFKGLLVDVTTTCGLMTFSVKKGAVFCDSITHLYDLQEKFYLYNYSQKEEYLNENIKYFDDSIQSQIDIQTNNTDLNNIKYQYEYMLEYFDKLKCDGKYIVMDENEKELTYNRYEGKLS